MQEGWAVIGAAVRGASHIRDGKPRQDAVGWWQGDGLLIAACADGAGSAERSDEGSSMAVEAAIARARSVAARGAPVAREASVLVRQCMRAARAGVRRVAAEANARPGAFATTLILCVATDEAVCLAQIGDGVTCVRTLAGMSSPFRPQRGSYANETTFITTGRRLPHTMLASYAASDVDGFCLSSDGLKLIITKDARTGEPFEPFFADVFGFASRGGRSEGLAAFLEKVEDRTDDDKSLVVAVRSNELSGG
ncbi:MAG TPA: PP2C family serine/threonine-protein phosphatase [Solirubrobacteraceae bacterium]|nr:PP2C family serine/threonine-protein phosphatase [Solirubrobacteraceae bacterium]